MLFFFYEYLSIFLTILILISAFSSISILLNDLFDKQEFMPKIEYDIKYIGKVTFNYLISCLIGFGIILAYTLTKNWLISNIIAISILLVMFRIMRVPSYKIAFILLSMAFIYDIYWVFLSSKLFGKSVMATVATKVDLPLMLFCPKI
jgi:hypothetical protein